MKIRYFVIIGILLAAITARIIWVNHAFPQAENIKIDKGACYVDEKGISYKVEKTKWLDKKQIEEEFDMKLFSVCIVTMQVENTSKKKKKLAAYDWYIEGENHFQNGVSCELFGVVNEEFSDMGVVLEPGEKIEWKLPYEFCNTIVYSFQNKKEMKSALYGLIKDRYPKKVWLVI
ncbi:MAG: hypothetical protein II073_01155 [Lachnospiraceae bacterium]|nr:hypothetical protein [Lachnospiraceae bacterium]